MAMVGLGALVGGIYPVFAESVKTYEPCLDYYAPGMSGCTSKPPTPKQPPVPSPTAVVNAPVSATISTTVAAKPRSEMTLDEKIDEFLKDQGKPPREFIAFYLDPTPENALRWAYKFQELQKRNYQITEAWTQAEQLVAQAQARGQNVSVLASETLPPVRALTSPIPDWNGLSGEGLMGNLALPVAPTGMEGLAGMGNPLGNLSQAMNPLGQSGGSLTIAGIAVNPPANTTAAPVIKPVAEDSFYITYYFSTDCPFCRKFQPEFVQLKNELGDRLEIGCVDVSPPGAPQSLELEVQLGCSVRKPQPDEIVKMGLKTTPTLLVRRGNAMQLERINGYVPGDKLKTWLLTGQPPT